MAEAERKSGEKKTTPGAGPAPEGQGESALRREALKEGGGVPLTDIVEDGDLRGVDEEGRHTTGTHGGPKKDGGVHQPDLPKR